MIYTLEDQIGIKKFITNRFKRAIIRKGSTVAINSQIRDEVESHSSLTEQQKGYIYIKPL